jgi:hypothetical protein
LAGSGNYGRSCSTKLTAVLYDIEEMSLGRPCGGLQKVELFPTE